ncbi:MAG: tRNA (adenosine(37)-N6)-threonylcarbamoyltransferase complex dimerization subunit type 1 TsaB [Planctomycetes bacterium]|nr:tRNA (adenosine(37)-N6)-threonylcarbamoyltransferase complex dimerization subunit type 1 TsaB [Planctomycetota bacterium]
MRTLGIESSGALGGVALLEEERLLDERIFEKGMVHGRDIAPAIDAILRDHRLAPADIDLVAVDIGPGSYTGLRVGLAAAKGLCLALGRPAAGVASVDALAHAARHPLVAVAIDAKWGQIYGALYERGVRVGPIVAEKPEDFARRVPAGALVVGDAAESYARLFPHAVLCGPELRAPRPSVVALLGLRSGRREDAARLAPLYLRPTEAEIKFRGPRG